MLRIKGTCLVIALLAAVTWTAAAQNGSYAADTRAFPDRCAYALAATANRFALFVSAQLTRLNTVGELSQAQTSLQLTIQLGCPKATVFKTIDCAVKRVQTRGGLSPDAIEILQCLEQASGKSFPKLGKAK
ncbi:MAG: hypothetical protein ACR2PI_28550 [Hyphomicrobiaceae bacterium]